MARVSGCNDCEVEANVDGKGASPEPEPEALRGRVTAAREDLFEVLLAAPAPCAEDDDDVAEDPRLESKAMASSEVCCCVLRTGTGGGGMRDKASVSGVVIIG